MTAAISKWVRVGALPPGLGSMFVAIRWDGSKLSISGVEGPLPNGDVRGSCGQCIDALDRIERLAEGVNQLDVDRLRVVWERWHLNDMRAHCAHQGFDFGDAEVEVVTYGLSQEAWRLKREAEAEVTRAALAGEVAQLTDAGRFLIGPDWFRDRFEAPDADSPLSGLFEVKKREKKRAGWVRPVEHPKGVLGVACDVCGHRYGSAWLREDVPADVIAFLRGLPDAGPVRGWSL